jgi:hypothetical protein
MGDFSITIMSRLLYSRNIFISLEYNETFPRLSVGLEPFENVSLGLEVMM